MEEIMNRNRRLDFEDENSSDEDKLEASDSNKDEDGGKLPAPSVGMEFETEEQAYQYYLAYAKRVGFGVRRSKSHNDKAGNLYSRIFVCSAEGKREEDGRRIYVKTPRAETRCGCMARMLQLHLDHNPWPFQILRNLKDVLKVMSYHLLKCSHLSVAINPTMSMTDLLMAQQSSGFADSGVCNCVAKCGCQFPCLGGVFCSCKR